MLQMKAVVKIRLRLELLMVLMATLGPGLRALAATILMADGVTSAVGP